MQLSDGRAITITPPTGAKLVAAQAWFGARFARLRDHPPTNDAGARKALTKVAKALAPYVTGLTTAELVDAVLAAPYDAVAIARAALGELAYTQKQRR